MNIQDILKESSDNFSEDQLLSFEFNTEYIESLEEIVKIGRMSGRRWIDNNGHFYFHYKTDKHYLTYVGQVYGNGVIYERRTYQRNPDISTISLKDNQYIFLMGNEKTSVDLKIVARNFLGYNVTIPVRDVGMIANNPNIDIYAGILSRCLINGFTDSESIKKAFDYVEPTYVIYSPEVEKVEDLDYDNRNKSLKKLLIKR